MTLAKTPAQSFMMAVLAALAVGAMGQDRDCYGGVYLTRDDFLNNRLSWRSSGADAISFAFPADLTLTVKVSLPDTTLKLAPGSIYGYADCGEIFRYFEGGEALNAQEDFYKIEEAGDIILYSSLLVSPGEIFYSRSLTSSIHRLTLVNLKKDFRGYPAFIDRARKLKRSPGGLATRDQNGFVIMDFYEEMITAKAAGDEYR